MIRFGKLLWFRRNKILWDGRNDITPPQLFIIFYNYAYGGVLFLPVFITYHSMHFLESLFYVKYINKQLQWWKA